MSKNLTKSSRRDFIKTSALAATALSGMTAMRSVHAAEGDSVLKVGLVGCGGRGRGAASQALNADANAQLVAVCDAFPDNASSAVEIIKKDDSIASRVVVTPETTFDGLESYKKVIDLCDVVLLCEPTFFRPLSLRYAVDKGKHVFCEKPVAVDGPGIQSVLETCRIAKEKKLQIVSGLCWRYDFNVQNMMKKVLDGAIGDVLSVRETYLTSRPWLRPKKAGDTEMMYQVRNWANFTWLSGDFNVEQHVHSLDKALWVFGDKPPKYAYGIGGRMRHTDYPISGDVYDAMSVVFEYEDGRTVYSLCRQQPNCWNDTEDYMLGTKGQAQILRSLINGEKQQTVKNNMYQNEHNELFKAIRSGGNVYINNGEYMAYSTMMGILGRLACYTGKRLTWDEALKMELPTTPTGLKWDDNPPTMPDEKGRYKIELPGLGLAYHEVVR